ncbi:hypothetical protein HPG69_009351 [Diceros bicornis minor]|uniref:Uncharacterized protein n=1 Tax=Diceros bicornis minor TaxID=77932 RepID=A0A7J7EY99_DICBM|nr:hypothetical protein HPG69_009351 [Diceros bicornis minor]
MGKAAGDETYFQRGSLFWRTVITLSLGYYTMVVAKAQPGRAATAYFRTARPLPLLVTVVGLGYFTVRHRARRRICLGPPGPRRARGAAGARFCACAPGGCLGYWQSGFFHSLSQKETFADVSDLIGILCLWFSFSGLSSGLRVFLIRASGPWAPSLSTWWTIITASCAVGLKASQMVGLNSSGSYTRSSLG